MTKINTQFDEIGLIDQTASMDSPIHRIDPRAKLLTTLAFIITVVSFGKYEISGLIPFSIYPIVMMAIGNLPFSHIMRRILLVAPFAVLIGIFNPLLDKTQILTIGTAAVSGGWVSFASIIIRFILTVGAAMVLLACTGIHGICYALERLGTPRPFTVQLLFLYRYMFVLMDEGIRMVRARAIRSSGSHGMEMSVYGHMLGHMLLRALDRAQRIHSAMCSRGFDGHIKLVKPAALKSSDILFTCVWITLFLAMRFYNISQLSGILVTEYFK